MAVQHSCADVARATIRTAEYSGVGLGDTVSQMKKSLGYDKGDPRFGWAGKRSDGFFFLPHGTSTPAKDAIVHGVDFDLDVRDRVERITISMICDAASSSEVVSILENAPQPLLIKRGGKTVKTEVAPLFSNRSNIVNGIRLTAR